MTGQHRAPAVGLSLRIAVVLTWLRRILSPELRGKIHAIAPALSTVLVATGILTDAKAAAWVAIAVFVADHLIAALHAETTVRAILYPAISVAATFGVAYGIVTEAQTSMALGLAAAVLGSAGAAWLTPRR